MTNKLAIAVCTYKNIASWGRNEFHRIEYVLLKVLLTKCI